MTYQTLARTVLAKSINGRDVLKGEQDTRELYVKRFETNNERQKKIKIQWKFVLGPRYSSRGRMCVCELKGFYS